MGEHEVPEGPGQPGQTRGEALLETQVSRRQVCVVTRVLCGTAGANSQRMGSPQRLRPVAARRSVSRDRHGCPRMGRMAGALFIAKIEDCDMKHKFLKMSLYWR